MNSDAERIAINEKNDLWLGYISDPAPYCTRRLWWLTIENLVEERDGERMVNKEGWAVVEVNGMILLNRHNNNESERKDCSRQQTSALLTETRLTDKK